MNKKIEPEVLHITARRFELLELIDAGISDKRVLEDKLSKSRPTINKGINELVESGLVSEGKEMVITECGQIALDVFEEVNGKFQKLEEIGSINNYLPDGLPIANAKLSKIFVYNSTRLEPDKPFRALDGIPPSKESLYAIVPSACTQYVDIIESISDKEGTTCRFILPSNIADAIQDNMNSELRPESMSVIKESPSYGIIVSDRTHVWIAAHTEGGNCIGAILAKSEELCKWSINKINNEFKGQS